MEAPEYVLLSYLGCMPTGVGPSSPDTQEVCTVEVMQLNTRSKIVALSAATFVALVASYVAIRLDRTPAAIPAAQESARSSNAPVELEGARDPNSRRTALAPAPDSAGRLTEIRLATVGAHTPIAGAVLRIESDRASAVELRTDADGIARGPSGTLDDSQVTITAEGVCDATFDVVGAPPSHLSYELFTAGDARVVVRDDTGRELAGVPVIVDLARPAAAAIADGVQRAVWMGPRDGRGPAFTDARGVRVRTGLPRGVALTFSAPSASKQVVLDATTPVTDVELVVPTTRCLKGRLVWEDGTVVTEPVTVQAWNTANNVSGDVTARSGVDGRFEFCRLPARRITWKVDHPGQLSRDTAMDEPVVDVGDIVLVRALECTGRLRRSEPQPGFSFASTRLHAFQDGRLVTEQLNVEEDGTFVVRIPAGPTRLVPWVVGVGNLATVDTTSPFHDLVIDLDALLGRLRIDHVPPAAEGSTLVVLNPVDGSNASESKTSTRRLLQTGGANAPVTREGEALSVHYPPLGTFEVHVTDTRSLWYCGRAVMTPGANVVLDASRFAPTALDVAVQDERGDALPRVELESCASWARGDVRIPRALAKSDAAGTAKFAALAAGEWIVYPRISGPSSPDAVVVVVPATSKATLVLRGGASGSLQGTVTRAGAPVADARVYVEPIVADASRPTNSFGSASRNSSSPPTTSKSGAYAIDGLPAGTYGVRFCWSVQQSSGSQASGFRCEEHRVRVTAGAPTRFDVDLDANLVRVVVRVDGVPFDALESGSFLGPDGVATLSQIPEKGPGWFANLARGPLVLSLRLPDVARHARWDSDQPRLVAWLPDVVVPSDELVVNVTGASIHVRLKSPDAAMPTARLRSIDEFGDVASFLGPSSLASTDEGGVRTFRHVPVGSTVELVETSRGVAQGPVRSIVVDKAGAIDVDWPSGS